MRRVTFRTRLFFCFLGVILAAMILPVLYVRQAVRQEAVGEATRSARREALLIRAMLESSPPAGRETLSALLDRIGEGPDLRVTYIDDDGDVLAESSPSHRALQALDNHADRVEVTEALRSGEGTSIRYSETLQTDLVYAAVKVPAGSGLPGGVLRVAVPLAGVKLHIADAMGHWFAILGAATLLALLLAYALSARLERSLREMIRVVEGIAAPRQGRDMVEIRGRRRLHVLPGREFRNLAAAVNNMADRIEADLQTIAEQKAQLETILDVMAEGVLVIGEQGRVRLVNRALIRLFPLAERAEGKNPVEIVPVAEIQQAIDDVLAIPPDQPAQIFLEVEPRPETVLSVHLIRPRDPVHDVLAVAVFHDVSEMARLIRVRREFVANVSHELRTPLTTIIGYAETLIATLGDLLDPSRKALPVQYPGGNGQAGPAAWGPELRKDAEHCVRFAETILRHARHMADMVNDLLKLSRIENGTVPMDMKEVRLSSVLSEVLSACRQMTADKELTVENRISGDPLLLADPHFLFQVFRNLLENACRYAPRGSEITLSAAPHASETGEELVFSVHDEGPGIPAEDLSRVFERFYRVEKHRGAVPAQKPGVNTPGSGDVSATTGLGLAICKHIVERHHGRIWAEDTSGATIRFTLPRAGRKEHDE